MSMVINVEFMNEASLNWQDWKLLPVYTELPLMQLIFQSNNRAK